MSTQAQHSAPTQLEFDRFKNLIFEHAGIFLPPNKITLLNNRVGKRLVARGCTTFSQYYQLIVKKSEARELELAIEHITTNETYFFREQKHFESLSNHIIPKRDKQQPFRAWSAACSTGEEPYSIGMVLQEYCTNTWQLVASDINTAVLNAARKGIYRETEKDKIPPHFRTKYCMKGVGEYSGKIRIAPEIRNQIQFRKENLMQSFSHLGFFDVIFLRNVMIYFERDTQIDLIARMTSALKPRGYLLIGHAESLNGVSGNFDMVKPSIYQRR